MVAFGSAFSVRLARAVEPREPRSLSCLGVGASAGIGVAVDAFASSGVGDGADALAGVGAVGVAVAGDASFGASVAVGAGAGVGALLPDGAVSFTCGTSLGSEVGSGRECFGASLRGLSSGSMRSEGV
jgi:hypothetical protein